MVPSFFSFRRTVVTVTTFLSSLPAYFGDLYTYQRRRSGVRSPVSFQFRSERLEARQLLSALGLELSSVELKTVFASNGRLGDSEVIDGVLYVPGGTPESPVVETLNLSNREVGTIVLEGVGAASGIFKKNGQIFFVGYSIGADNTFDVTYWDQSGKATVIPDPLFSRAMSVSSAGRMLIERSDGAVGYVDIGENVSHVLPGVSGFNLTPYSITPDGMKISASGFDSSGKFIGLVYGLNLSTGEYSLSNVDFRSSTREGMNTMNLFDSPNGVLSASFYTSLETGENRTVIFSLDGNRHADFSGVPQSVVSVGKNIFVTMQDRVVILDENFNDTSVTATALFGAGFEFQPGSLAVTQDETLVVIATKTENGVVVVKTYQVPKVVKPTPVPEPSIVVPTVATTGPVNVSWAGEPDATYDVLITSASTTGRSAPLFSGVVAESSVTLGRIPADEYIIQVYKIIKGVKSDVTTKSFAVQLNQVVAAKIKYLPTVSGKESFVAVEPVPGATGYYFWISRKGQDDVNAYGGGIGSDISTFYIPKLEPGEYNISVKALGVISTINADWSDKRTFRVVLPKPEISGIRLMNAIEGVESVLTLPQVQAPAKLEVWVYSLKKGIYILKTDTQARSLQIPNLESGGYRIWVRAIDAKGGASLWSSPINVTVAAPATQIRDLFRRMGNIDLRNIQVQVKNSKGVVVGTYKGPSETILGLLALKPGSYKVKVLNLTLDYTVYRPAVTPTVTFGTDLTRPTLGWTESKGTTSTVWIGYREGGKLVYFKGANVSGNTYTIPAGYPPRVYEVWVRVNYSDGSTTLWEAGVNGVNMDVGGKAVVTAASTTNLNWSYAGNAKYFQVMISDAEGKTAYAVIVNGKTLSFKSILSKLPKVGDWKIRVRAVAGPANSTSTSTPLPLSRWSDLKIIDR